MEDETLPAPDAVEQLADAKTLPATESAVSDLHARSKLSREAPERYAFGEEIGRGGLGRVMVARDEHIGRDVAVKELLLDGADSGGGGPNSQANERFLREARVTGQLEHPSIVPVYEIGERASGDLYYTMRRVRQTAVGLSLDGMVLHPAQASR